MQPIMTAAQINAFLDTDFPQIHTDGKVFTATSVSAGRLTMAFNPGERHLRAGGTVSGPSMFALADVAAYTAVLAHIGPVAQVVTTNLNINFLRLPQPRPIHCDCRILKLGRRLAVVDTLLYQDDPAEPVAQATATYSIPPAKT